MLEEPDASPKIEHVNQADEKGLVRMAQHLYSGLPGAFFY